MIDREAWRVAVHGVAKSWTRLSNWTELNWDSSCFGNLLLGTENLKDNGTTKEDELKDRAELDYGGSAHYVRRHWLKSRPWSQNVCLWIPWWLSSKEASCNAEAAGDAGLQDRSLGWEDPLKEGMTTHSSVLAWRIPWTEEPGGQQSNGWQRVGQDWSDLAGAPFTSRVPHDSMPIFLICKMGILTELSWKLGESSEILRKYPAFGMDHTDVCHYLSSVFSQLKSDPPLNFSALRTI